MLVHRHYDSRKYPLKYFEFKNMPKRILKVIEKLDDRFHLVLRGGLSYILLTGDCSYPLKDVDLAMNARDAEEIFQEIEGDADEIYYNKNTFGGDVVTLFFRDGDEYFKIDILMVHELPDYITAEFNLINREMKVMDGAELWYNRICKVAEKELRGHSNQKTLNHYRVVLKVSRFMLKNPKKDSRRLRALGFEKVRRKIEDSVEVLKGLLKEGQLEEYMSLTQEVLIKYGEGNGEDTDLSIEKSR